MGKKPKINTDSQSQDKINLGELLGVPYRKAPSPSNSANALNSPPAKPLPKTKLGKAEAEIWFSKKGRAGKVASVVHLQGMARSEQEMVFKDLKIKLACGGNIKNKEWVLQTSRRDLIKDFLEKKGIRCKLCGG